MDFKGGICTGWLEEEIAFEQVQRLISRNNNSLRAPNEAISEPTSRQYERWYTLVDDYGGGGGGSSRVQLGGFRVEGASDNDCDFII